MAKLKKLNLKIGGMHCAGCAAGIEKGLASLEGVSQAQVNFATETAQVTFDEKRRREDEIFEAISGLGYSAQKAEKTQNGAAEELRAAKSKFISALILTIPIAIVSMTSMFRSPHTGDHRIEGVILILLTAPVLFYSGREIFRDAYRQTTRLRANMNSLIALGSLAAFLYSGYILLDISFIHSGVEPHFYFETAAVIVTLILLGRFLESRAKGKARDAIGALLKLRPEKGTALIEGREVEVDVGDIRPGLIMIVKAGEKIPADGKVIEGAPYINESALTGESLPVEKKVGDPVIGGSVNGDRPFKFQATDVGEETFLAGVIRLVNEAQNRKAPAQKLADRIAGVFAPIVLGIALMTLIIWFFADRNSSMLLKAPVAVLIIACPCALGLATPTAILAGSGRAARRGIYFRGGDILENTAHATHVIFDKTGTLTEGRCEAVNYQTGDAADDELLFQLAASIESSSAHPLARAIVNKAKSQNIEILPAKNMTELPGMGIKGEIDGLSVIAGSSAAMEAEKIDIGSFAAAAEDDMAKGRTVVYVARDGAVLGYLAIADKIKDEAPAVISKILESGREVMMLSGDNYKTAGSVARQLGISKFEAGIKPDQKALIVETLRRVGNKVIMVGDGINDAPALAAADIGVALGSGTDVAMESADIILVRDNLVALVEAIEISQLTYRVIKQNLFWAFFYNIISIPIAAGVLYPLFGFGLSPIIAAAAMSFSSLFVVSNSLRLLKI
jgi:Cu+-exporting ATPase